MIVKKYKNFLIKIYFNQYKGGVYVKNSIINRYPVNKNKINFYSKMLMFLNIAVVLTSCKNKKKKIRPTFSIDKIMLIVFFVIKKNKTSNNNKKNDKYIKENYKNNKLNFWILFFIIIILLIIVFIFDYKTTSAKINQLNDLEIKKIETDYNINKCETQSHYSSLKQECEMMLNKIKLLKLKRPTILSTFFIWILDILNSFYNSFSLINCLLILLIFIIFAKMKLFNFNIFRQK